MRGNGVSPMESNDFLWWQWLLVGLGAYALCAVCSLAMRHNWKAGNEGLRYPLALAAADFGLSGTIFFLFSAIRFFGWPW